MQDTILYKLLRPLLKVFTKLFIRPKFIGLENIPKNGSFILAGNHISNLDCLLLISSTKRCIHFLAKDSLWRGLKKIIFSNLGLIPVNRKTKDHSALFLAEKYLKNKMVIGIFPEGTTQKGRGLLPFKKGTVKMAIDTNTKIIPFVIIGKYRLLFNNLIIKFGKPFSVKTTDVNKENEKLRNLIIKMMEE